MQFIKLTEWFFIVVLALVTLAFFDILSTYFSAILWAAILTIIFYPIKDKLQRFLNKNNELASFLTISIICLIVFIPLAVIVCSLATELNLIYNELQHDNTYFLKLANKLFIYLPNWAQSFLTEYDFNDITYIQQKLSEILSKSGQYLAGSAFLIGRGTFGFTVSFGIMLYLLFFLLKDGPYLVHQILNFLPLSNLVKEYLFAKFAAVVRATVKGTIIVALAQGILGGFAFYIVDISRSILCGAFVACLSLIPTIGSAIVWVPTAIYLIIIQKVWQGLFIISFFLLVIGLVDNFLRPLLVGKDTKMPDYLVLITTLGGIEIYSINGFIIGPLIAALFIACWNILSEYDHIDSVKINNNLFKKR